MIETWITFNLNAIELVSNENEWNKKTVIETINSIDVKLNDWCGVFTCNWVAILYIWSNAKQQSPLSITYHSQHENTDSIQRKTHTIKYSKEGNGCNSCSKSMTSTFNAYWLLPLINTVFKAFKLYTVVAILERKQKYFLLLDSCERGQLTHNLHDANAQ